MSFFDTKEKLEEIKENKNAQNIKDDLLNVKISVNLKKNVNKKKDKYNEYQKSEQKSNPTELKNKENLNTISTEDIDVYSPEDPIEYDEWDIPTIKNIYKRRSERLKVLEDDLNKLLIKSKKAFIKNVNDLKISKEDKEKLLKDKYENKINSTKNRIKNLKILIKADTNYLMEFINDY